MARRSTIARRSAVLGLWLTLCVTGPFGLRAQQLDPDAFVYILNLGIRDNKIVYNGLRTGFAVADGRTILTAAHCVEDFGNANHSLFQPLVISRYYGDIFEAEIVDSDGQNDIAILKPAWNRHPALRIETNDRWKDAKRIIIAGYQPSDLAQGGNTRLSRRMSLQQEDAVRTNGRGRYAIQLGSVRYPGKGWSGSAFVQPDTGAVVGVLSNERYIRRFFLKRHYIFGCDPEAIHEIFGRNDLSLSPYAGSLPKTSGGEHFDSILELFDSILANQNKRSHDIVRKLCEMRPDSYVLQILAGWMLDAPFDEDYYRRAIELASYRAFPHAAYGSHLLSQDRPKQALQEFQNAVAIDPNHVFAHTGRIVALTQTNPSEAELEARKLTERWPSDGGFWFELSRTLRKQRKYEQELAVIQKAIELPHPERLEHLYQRHLADSLTNNENYPLAEQTYKALLENHPCARCWSAYTSLLVRIGPDRTGDARKALENVKAMNEDDSVAQSSIRRLETIITRMTRAGVPGQ